MANLAEYWPLGSLDIPDENDPIADLDPFDAQVADRCARTILNVIPFAQARVLGLYAGLTPEGSLSTDQIAGRVGCEPETVMSILNKGVETARMFANAIPDLNSKLQDLGFIR